MSGKLSQKLWTENFPPPSMLRRAILPVKHIHKCIAIWGFSVCIKQHWQSPCCIQRSEGIGVFQKAHKPHKGLQLSRITSRQCVATKCKLIRNFMTYICTRRKATAFWLSHLPFLTKDYKINLYTFWQRVQPLCFSTFRFCFHFVSPWCKLNLPFKKKTPLCHFLFLYATFSL